MENKNYIRKKSYQQRKFIVNGDTIVYGVKKLKEIFRSSHIKSATEVTGVDLRKYKEVSNLGSVTYIGIPYHRCHEVYSDSL